MYQRRQKRVAGPGFHVNVKMDQFQIQSMRGRHGAKQQSDLLPSSSQSEVYDIKEQELLVSAITSGSIYHDGYTHVFSSINGYQVGSTLTKQQIIDKILGEVRFVGIATTEQKADDKLIDQGCVATVGGVQTILNNGTKAIHPSQKVMLDINLEPGRASITREKGIPRQKVRFSVKPADDDIVLIKRAMGMCEDLNVKDPNVARQLQQQIQKLRTERNEFNSLAKQVNKRAGILKAKDLAKKSSGVSITQGVDATTGDLDMKAADDAELAALEKDYIQQAKDKNIEKSKAEQNLKQCTTNPLAGSMGNDATLDAEKLKQFLTNYRRLNELVIGKAMSYAAPGDRFEILLQPRYSL